MAPNLRPPNTPRISSASKEDVDMRQKINKELEKFQKQIISYSMRSREKDVDMRQKINKELMKFQTQIISHSMLLRENVDNILMDGSSTKSIDQAEPSRKRKEIPFQVESPTKSRNSNKRMTLGQSVQEIPNQVGSSSKSKLPNRNKTELSNQGISNQLRSSSRSKLPYKMRRSRLTPIGRIPQRHSTMMEQVKDKEQVLKETELTEEKFQQMIQFLDGYKEGDQDTNIYPKVTQGAGPKGVAVNEADPIQVFLLFQSGLLELVYFRETSIFRFFPPKLKAGIDMYKRRILRDRIGFLKCISTYPIYEQGKMVQPAIQVCQLGTSNGGFPTMEKYQFRENENECTFYINNYVAGLRRLYQIEGKINYSAKSIIIWSRSSSIGSFDERIREIFIKRMANIGFDIPDDMHNELCYELCSLLRDQHNCKNCKMAAVESPSNEGPEDESIPIIDEDVSQDEP